MKRWLWLLLLLSTRVFAQNECGSAGYFAAETSRDATGVVHQVSCLDPVTGKINFPWCIGCGGGGTPSGSTNYVQVNNAGSFGSDASFQWDLSHHSMQIGQGTQRLTKGIQIGAGDPATPVGLLSDYGRVTVADTFTATGQAFQDLSVYNTGTVNANSFVAEPQLNAGGNYFALEFAPQVPTASAFNGGLLGLDWNPSLNASTTVAHLYGIYGRGISGSGTVTGGGALVDLEQNIGPTITSGFQFLSNNCTHYISPAAGASNSFGCRSSFGDATAMFGGTDNTTSNDVIYVDQNNTGAHQLTTRFVNGFANSIVVGNTGGTTFLGIDGSKGTLSTYNSEVTAGPGVAYERGATSQKSETGTADANVLTVTPAAAAGTYRLHFVASVSSATSGVIGWTATWKDSNSNAQSPTELSLFQSGTAAPALTYTVSAAGNYYGDAIIDVDNSATNIVIKWVGGGTTAAKVSATVERLQ